MTRKYNAAILFLLATMVLFVQGCARSPKEERHTRSTNIGDSTEEAKKSTAQTPANKVTVPTEPERSSRAGSSAQVRALPVDRLLGGRPLDRILPEDYTLGPLQDFQDADSGSCHMAAEACRKFLDGLRKNRLEGTDPEANSVLQLLLSEEISGEFTVRKWRMGAGIQGPEGGFSFSALLDSERGRARAEIHVDYHSASGWGVDWAIVDTENLEKNPGANRQAFDPTIRTAKSQGR